MKLIDPELLRTFLAFTASGSLARAADSVGRSPSAVTAQMQRLEELIGEPILVQDGRGRALTPVGEALVIQAQRILNAHQDAWLDLKGIHADGRVVLGATQDFSENPLPDLLARFSRSHPRATLELRIGRSAELTQALAEGRIDVLVSMRSNPEADEIAVFHEPMAWIMSERGLIATSEDLPLALLDPPCGFRSTALATLNAARRPFRIAVSSGNLSGLHAAVRAGLAITLRTKRWIGPGLMEAPASMKLPNVAEAEYAVRLKQPCSPAAQTLADLLSHSLGGAAMKLRSE